MDTLQAALIIKAINRKYLVTFQKFGTLNIINISNYTNTFDSHIIDIKIYFGEKILISPYIDNKFFEFNFEDSQGVIKTTFTKSIIIVESDIDYLSSFYFLEKIKLKSSSIMKLFDDLFDSIEDKCK